MITGGRRLMAVFAATVMGMGGMGTLSAQTWPGGTVRDIDPGPDDPKAPAKQIYDEKADAKSQIAAALKVAQRDNTRVLVQWGGNWCPWCIKLHNTFKTDKDIAHELLYEYSVVLVDAGRPAGKNMELATSYGADLATHGFPFLTVLDSSGKPIANQDTGALEEKDAKGEATGKHDAAAVLAFLKKNQVTTPFNAAKQLEDALALAKQQDKRVFLHFGAPWCGWCHKLENWMARPEVAAVLAKDFVDLKIDTDRATGAKDIFMRFNPKESGGIPWFVFLDSSGAVLATSDNAKGDNIGFPAAAEEVAHFETMLTKAAKHMTAADMKGLVEGLKEKK